MSLSSVICHIITRCVSSDRDQIFIGDDNALTLEVSAENQGEGAYEAELHVFPPPQADFTGVVRSKVSLGFWGASREDKHQPQ